MIKEASAGATATLANFKTSSGTAAGISGQGSLATQNSAAWASDITGRPSNVAALAGSEVINNATLQSALTGGTVVPQTASGITSQGSFATLNQIALGSTYLKRADGTTAVSESLVVTSLGTASAITGQGSLATANSAAWGSQVSGRPSNVAALAGSEVINNATLQSALTGGSVVPATASAITSQGAFATFNQLALNTTYIKRADGTTMLTESLVITSVGVASAITSQGTLATLNSADTAQIAASAITNYAYNIVTNLTKSYASNANVITCAITTKGGRVALRGMLYSAVNNSGRHTLYIRRDSTYAAGHPLGYTSETDVSLGSIGYLQSSSVNAGWPIIFMDEPYNGTHTYKVSLTNSSGDATVTFPIATLDLTEYKR